MPRHNSVRRENGHVVIVIDSVAHTISEPAFIAMMQQAINVLQSLVASQQRASES